jgi:ABC-type transporter Mla subunit MlaD
MKRSIWLLGGLVTTLMLACANQKDPAQQAITKIDSALSAVHDSAAKYSPDTLQSVEGQVGSIKQSYAKGDYSAVLKAAPTVNTAIANLKQDVDSKQAAADAELAKVKQQWRTTSDEVVKLLAGLHTQVDTLSKAKKLPKGITKASFESSKDGVNSLDGMWTDANNTVANGDYPGAVAKGQAVKDKAAELMKALGMKSS